MEPKELKSVYDTLLQQMQGIDLLIERRLLYPSLVLIFTGIDAVGALAAPAEKVDVRTRFTSWVEKYLVQVRSLPARPIDLYAARCGLVHTLTADAHLITKGEAIALSYAWGNADPADLQSVIDKTVPGRTVAVHVRDLAAGFRLGTIRMFEDASDDVGLRDRIRRRAARFFTSLPADLSTVKRPPVSGA